MSYVSRRTDANSKITLEHSAKYASRTTSNSTRYAIEAEQRRVAAIKAEVKLPEQKHQLEMTIIEMVSDKYLAEMQDQIQKLKLKNLQKQRQREDEKQALHRKHEENIKALERARRLSIARESNQRRPSEDKVRRDEGEETIYDNQAVKKYRTGDAQQNMGVSELDSKKRNSGGNTHNKRIAAMTQENSIKQSLDTKQSATVNTDQKLVENKKVRYEKQGTQQELQYMKEEERQSREEAYAKYERERAARERHVSQAGMVIKLSQATASEGSKTDKIVNPITASILSYNATNNESNRTEEHCTVKKKTLN